MLILLLVICFGSLFINLNTLTGGGAGKKELLLSSVLIFCGFIALITETLSAFQQLNFVFILSSWLVITGINLWYLILKRNEAGAFLSDIKKKIHGALQGLTIFEKVILYSAAFILTLVFAQGIIYPPNNWDSMTYHMARITSWVSHQSVAYYPTHIFYQLFQPPFAEYVIMHFDVLNRADYFSSTVQFIFLLFSLVAILAILKAIGLGRKYQVLAIVLGATIPEVLLQASSTQNDIVVSFFLLSACYFALTSVKQPKFINYLSIGLAAGIGILTKGTAYIYLSPILLFFGIRVFIQLFKTKNLRFLWYGLMIIVLILAININQYERNYDLSQSFLGITKTDLHSATNEKMGPALLASGMLKNAGVHMGIMGTSAVAKLGNKLIYKLHAIMGVTINNENNFGNMPYTTPYAGANQEDIAPNFFHFLLITIAIIIFCVYSIKHKQSLSIYLLFLTVLLQGILFCGYLKWQPWNTRLHVPLFLMSVPLICYAASVSNWFKKTVSIIIPVIILYALVISLHNSIRPYLSVHTDVSVFDGRYKKYFGDKPAAYPEYSAVKNEIDKQGYKNIGLILGFNDWEYPLFTECFSKELNPVYIEVDNTSNHIANVTNNIDCIVSTIINKPYIDFNKQRFYNTTPKNKVAYLYKKTL